MIKADLHIHSKYSPDGEYEVADIVDMVAGAKVGVFTLSDHNSVSAICEAVVLAEERNIGFIPGIEIDCVFEGTDMHLLGYGINWESEDFISLEQDIRTKTLDSLSEMLYNLARLGIEVEADEVMRLADGRLPSGELIAEALLSNPEYDYPELEPYRQCGARADMP